MLTLQRKKIITTLGIWGAKSFLFRDLGGLAPPSPYVEPPLVRLRFCGRSRNQEFTITKTYKICGLGVSKIPVFSCLRPFVSGRTYVHQALELIKYYFVHMQIGSPGLPVEGILCLAQDTNVNVDKVRTNYIYIYE